ncbi:MAG: Tn3 family transposase, partial [Thiohalocapsa sp.]
YDNSLILSAALGQLERRGEIGPAETLKRVSPVAWQHINFYGRYQFDEDLVPLDFEQLRQQLSSEAVNRLYANTNP